MKKTEKRIKNVLLAISIVLFGVNFTFAQRNFYVSAAGKDSNNGRSASSPWKTIAKVNSSNSDFRAGDVIHFRKGDVFYGKLDIRGRSGSSAEPIVFKSYGSGKIPVIRASKKVTGWTKHRGDIWRSNVAKISNARTPSLFLNNEAQQIGREPNYSNANGGYRVVNSHTSNFKRIMESSPLPYSNNRFKGGEINIRSAEDLMKVEKITGHSGNSVNFTLSQSKVTLNELRNGFGYFFQNHVNTLDKQGEWAHDIVAGRLYLYSNANPNSLSVEIPSETSAAVVNNCKYMEFQGLRFENGLENVFNMNGSQNITIKGCYFYNGNEYSLIGYNLTNIEFRNNTIDESNNVGLRWEGCSGITFANNKVMNIGMRPGMSPNIGFIAYTGVRIISRAGSAPNVIEKNIVDKIGYHAVNFSGGNFKIRYNEVKNFCVVKDDGGGIYTVGNRNTNNSIYRNTVYNGLGAFRGAPANRGPKTGGIYLDNDSQSHLIYENSISNVAGWGIMLNLSNKNTVRDNTIYNCGTGIVLANYPNSFGIGGTTAKATKNTVLRNIFFSRKSDQYSSAYNNPTTSAGFNTFLGTLNTNYYCQPYSGGKQITARVGSNKKDYTLAQFKAAFPNYEANGKNAPVKFSSGTNPNSIIRFEMNPTGTAKTVNLGSTNYVDAKNNNYSGSVTIPAYSSLVLLKGTGGVSSAQLIANGTVNAAASIAQNGENELMDVVIYPNPAHNFVHISGVETGSSIAIKDLQGRTVYSTIATTQEEKISVVDFKAGMYLISVKDKAPIKLTIR